MRDPGGQLPDRGQARLLPCRLLRLALARDVADHQDDALGGVEALARDLEHAHAARHDLDGGDRRAPPSAGLATGRRPPVT